MTACLATTSKALRPPSPSFVATSVPSRLRSALFSSSWSCTCLLWSNQGLFLYIDGVLVDSDDITSENLTLNHSDSVLIGRRDTTGYDFQGYICNVGYWNAALTQPQVKSIMNKNYAALSASEKTNLVSWWNLDEETNVDGTAGTGGVKDHEGSNHGTLE